MLPLLNEYKEEISDWLIAEHDLDVRVESLDARWDSSGPVLVLQGASIAASDNLPINLNIKETKFRLAFWQSLSERNLVFNKIALLGVDLVLKPQSDTEADLPTLDALSNIFLEKLQDFSILDSRLTFYSPRGRETLIQIDELSWLNKGNHHQGVGKASLVSGLGENHLEFVIDLFGSGKTFNSDLTGQLYVEAKEFALSPLLERWWPERATLGDGVLNFQLWADLAAAGVTGAQLKMGRSELNWSMADKKQSLLLDQGLFQWAPDATGWQLDSYDLVFHTNESAWKEPRFQLYKESGRYYGSATQLDLTALLPVAGFFSPESSATLSKLALTGNLSKLRFTAKDNSSGFLLAASVDDLSNGDNPDKTGAILPSFELVKADFLLSQDGGKALVSIDNQKLDFGKHFNAPMLVERLSLPLSWRKNQAGIELLGEMAELTTPDLNAKMSFKISLSEQKAPFLSLYTEVELNDAGQAEHYYPIKAMGRNVYDYLQPTLKKGKVDNAKILWFGDLSQFPYDNHEGVFQAWVPLKQVEYEFYPGWLPLHQMQLDLLFENRALYMNSKQASLLNAKSDSISAVFEELSQDAVLKIKANIAGTGAQITDYIQASPLADSVGKALDVINIAGNVRGKLELNIPLNGQPTQTKGTVFLKNNDIVIVEGDKFSLPIKQASGSFNFNNGDLSGKNLNARLFGQKLNISFSGQEQEESYQTKVALAGDWMMKSLPKDWNIVSPLKLQGKLNWRGELDLSLFESGKFNYQLALDSATQGLAVGLPEPWHKNPLKSWPLSLVAKGNEINGSAQLTIENKLYFDGLLHETDSGTELGKAWLHIGKTKPSIRPKGHQALTIAWAQLDITPWLALAKTTPAGGKQSQFSPEYVKVNLNNANLYGQGLQGVSLLAKKENTSWALQIASDQIKGKVSFSESRGKGINITLDKLNLPDFEFSQLKGDMPETKGLSWTQLPRIDLSCGFCQLGNYELGKVSGRLVLEKDGVRLHDLSLTYPHSSVLLNGSWRGQGRSEFTEFKANLETQDVETLVQKAAYASPIKGTPATASMQLSWQGAPSTFNPQTLNGEFKLDTQAGYVADVSDKGTRLFSLLSLDSIRRKLNLDFRDVFSTGLYYDSMSGTAKIENGIVINDNFFLDGAAGKLAGKGKADLNQWKMNYQMTFYPDVTSSLPVLAAFTLTPVTGLYVLALSKLLEPVVETITQVNFELSGDLSDPTLKEVGRRSGEIEVPKELQDGNGASFTDPVTKRPGRGN